jgi:hypothetical protein
MAWMGDIYALIIRWVTTGEPEPQRIMDSLVPVLLKSVGYDLPVAGEMPAAAEASGREG